MAEPEDDDLPSLLDPVALASQLERLRAVTIKDPDQVVTIQIGLVQLRILMELSLLATKVQHHTHLPHVLEALYESLNREVPGMSAELEAGRYDILTTLFKLISGQDYEACMAEFVAEHDPAATKPARLKLVQPD